MQLQSRTGSISRVRYKFLTKILIPPVGTPTCVWKFIKTLRARRFARQKITKQKWAEPTIFPPLRVALKFTTVSHGSFFCIRVPIQSVPPSFQGLRYLRDPILVPTKSASHQLGPTSQFPKRWRMLHNPYFNAVPACPHYSPYFCRSSYYCS